jgi:RNA polymerase sigma-32 factor
VAGLKTPGGRSALRQYFREVHYLQPLSRVEEDALLRQYVATQDPRVADKIITAHLRLVIKVAMAHSGHGCDVEDMISAGNLGVMEALRRFDPTMGFKFSTYAVWWIRQGVLKVLQSGRSMVRISAAPGATKAFYGLSKAEACVRAGATDDMTQDDVDVAVAARLGVRAVEFNQIKGRLAGRDPVGTMVEEQHQQARINLVLEALSRLPLRAQQVLRGRFLDPDQPTLATLGVRLGVSRERVRQIEEKALVQLRRHLTNRDLDPAAM